MTPDLEDALEPLRPYPGERQDSMWALLMLDDQVHTALELEGGIRPHDDLYCHNLMWVLDESPVDAVVLVVSRHDGTAQAADSAMWQRIRRDARRHRVRYEGMVVVGPAGWSWVEPPADGCTL